MKSRICAFLALGIGQLVHAQFSVVTVYILDRADLPDGYDPDYGDVSWSASVVEATPTATTYQIEHSPWSILDGSVSVFTLVNGPSTYAQWQVYNGSSTYGEFCDVTSEAETYSCNVTYLGAMANGTGAERQSTTFLETASNTYDEENRTWAAVPITITDGPELASTPTAPPGQMEAAATSDGAAESREAAEDGAAAGSVIGRASMLMAVAVGALVAL